MIAVIESGGKQHTVSEGESLKVELLTAEEGSTIEFDKVLARWKAVLKSKPKRISGKETGTTDAPCEAKFTDCESIQVTVVLESCLPHCPILETSNAL